MHTASAACVWRRCQKKSYLTAWTLPADGATCIKGLRVLDTASCVQPLCIPDGAQLP